LGEGTTFTVKLPVWVEERAEPVKDLSKVA